MLADHNQDLRVTCLSSPRGAAPHLVTSFPRRHRAAIETAQNVATSPKCRPRTAAEAPIGKTHAHIDLDGQPGPFKGPLRSEVPPVELLVVY